MMKRSPMLLALLATTLTGTGRADIGPAIPEPMTDDEINRQRWWLAFCHEITAIGGIVAGGPNTPLVNENGELNVKVPKHRVPDAMRIVKKYSTMDPTQFRE